MIAVSQINRLLVESNKKGDLNVSPMKARMTLKKSLKSLKLRDPQDLPPPSVLAASPRKGCAGARNAVHGTIDQMLPGYPRGRP
jgi:hypothetical protein